MYYNQAMAKRYSSLLNVILPVLVSGMVLAACSTTDKEDAAVTLPAEELYAIGTEAISDKKFKTAAENLLDIEKNYPYSPLAAKGQVMAAFAYYRDQEYDDAIDLIERFVKVNPGHKDTPYMYYLRALSYYERIADVRRDQRMTEMAQAALNDVMLRYPESDYARDAKLKLDLVRDHLAGKQMEIGRFYQKNGRYIAAINRFKDVVKNYETTSHAQEALYRLAEVYLAMGVKDEAKKYAAVLGHNYPGSKWYQYAYTLVEKGSNSPVKTKSSWISEALTFEQREDTSQCEADDDACFTDKKGLFDKVGDWF